MNEYYLHLKVAVGGKAWERVDEYTYNNWDTAIVGTDVFRYDGKRFCRDKNGICLQLNDISETALGIVLRILNVRADTTATVREGFYSIPEYVKFAKKNKMTVLHEMNGETFRLTAA